MAKGNTCPHCNELKLHDEGSYRKCSGCKYIGWAWNQDIKNVGKGSGKKCPHCSKQTLHEIGQTECGEMLRRCGTCNYISIEPSINLEQQ